MELNKKWCKSREAELLYRGKKEKEKRLNMLPPYVHYPQKKKKKKISCFHLLEVIPFWQIISCLSV